MWWWRRLHVFEEFEARDGGLLAVMCLLSGRKSAFSHVGKSMFIHARELSKVTLKELMMSILVVVDVAQ